MLRGIEFEADNTESVLRNLDAIMDASQYVWYIDDTDLNYFYFRSGIYSGKEFKDALDTISTLSFARIRRYPLGAQIDCVDEYEDFIKSDCDLLILFFDGGYYEVFGKEEEILLRIMDICQKYGYENTRYVFDAEDERTYMHF